MYTLLKSETVSKSVSEAVSEPVSKSVSKPQSIPQSTSLNTKRRSSEIVSDFSSVPPFELISSMIEFSPSSTYALTQREQDIILLLTLGKTNMEISKALDISIETVKKYTISIFKKMNVKNRIQAAVKAIKEEVVVFIEDKEEKLKEDERKEKSIQRRRMRMQWKRGRDKSS